MERKLFYLFKKSLVSWKGRKYKSQCESKTTSFTGTNTIRDRDTSVNKTNAVLPYGNDILVAAMDKTKRKQTK